MDISFCIFCRHPYMKRPWIGIFNDRAAYYFTTGIEKIFTGNQYWMPYFFYFQNIALMQMLHYHTSLPTGSPQSYSPSSINSPSNSAALSSRVLWRNDFVKVITPFDTVTSKISFNAIPALFSISFDSLIPWLLPHSFTCACM